MVNSFVLKNSGEEEINDVKLPGLQRLFGCNHTFLLKPTSAYWRFGLRFLLNGRNSGESSSRLYNDSQIYHFEICVGERINDKDWHLPNRLQIQQYNFKPDDQLLHRFDEYDRSKAITLMVVGLSDTLMNVKVSVENEIVFERVMNTFNRDYFHSFAWCDFHDFEVKGEHILFYNSIDILSKANKAMKSDQQLTIGALNLYFGSNNSGKSSLIRSICKSMIDRHGRVCDYIGVHRYIAKSEYSAELETSEDKDKLRRDHRNRRCDGALGELEAFDWMEELALMDDADRAKVINWYNQHFEEWKFTEVRLSKYSSDVEVRINAQKPSDQGAGGRAVLPIIIQLFNPEIELLAIDEPELGLEPRVQKILFEAIKSASLGRNGFPVKRIMVASHSHLFLDRSGEGKNYRVSKSSGDIHIREMNEEREILEATFNLLGANPTDLFFPANIIVVEGKSDQIYLQAIYRKMLSLGIATKDSIAFHFLGGFDGMEVGIFGVEQMLKTQRYIPIYREKICGIFDNPNDERKLARVQKIREFFNDSNSTRFVVLEKPAIEYYYPVDVINKVFGRDLSDEAFLVEVEAYLNQTKSHAGVGKFLGRKISKTQFADLITTAIDQDDKLPVLDGTILALLTKAESLAF